MGYCRAGYESYLKEPRTGLAVSADACDPKKETKHTPLKHKEAQRLAFVAENVIHHNRSVPAYVPRPVQVSIDHWNASCGHLGICSSNEKHIKRACWAIRVK